MTIAWAAILALMECVSVVPAGRRATPIGLGVRHVKHYLRTASALVRPPVRRVSPANSQTRCGRPVKTVIWVHSAAMASAMTRARLSGVQMPV